MRLFIRVRRQAKKSVDLCFKANHVTHEYLNTASHQTLAFHGPFELMQEFQYGCGNSTTFSLSSALSTGLTQSSVCFSAERCGNSPGGCASSLPPVSSLCPFQLHYFSLPVSDPHARVASAAFSPFWKSSLLWHFPYFFSFFF